jgi:hypothetical protein
VRWWIPQAVCLLSSIITTAGHTQSLAGVEGAAHTSPAATLTAAAELAGNPGFPPQTAPPSMDTLPFMFVHIPKCAGTSVRNALYKVLTEEGRPGPRSGKLRIPGERWLANCWATWVVRL